MTIGIAQADEHNTNDTRTQVKEAIESDASPGATEFARTRGEGKHLGIDKKTNIDDGDDTNDDEDGDDVNGDN